MGKPGNARHYYLICVLLVLATVAVYWQVAGFDFINFDDNAYVIDNAGAQAGITPASIHWALTTTYQTTWIPLVWMSFMADHDMGSLILGSDKIDPRVCHITNLVLHIANVLLLFLILAWITGYPWRSAFVAAIFALHPLHVESVAWITERKDVLSTFFWLLTMLAYWRYVQQPDKRRYGYVLLAFVLGLMSKPMLVGLPIILLILDFWPLRRLGTGDKQISFNNALCEKIPLFVLMIPATMITWYAYNIEPIKKGAVFIHQPIGQRIANAFYSYIWYIGKMLLPQNLGVFYPFPGNTLPVWQILGAVILFLVLFMAAFRMMRMQPYVTAGWLWYVVTLLPVIGLIQVGKHGRADRFTYIPLIGLSIIIAWGIPDLLSRLKLTMRWRLVTHIFTVAIIVVLAICTYKQVSYWHNSFTLFSHTVQVTGPNDLAQYNLGGALQEEGRLVEAENHYRQSLRISPDDPGAMYSLGYVLAEQSKYAEAIKQFNHLLNAYPKYDPAHNYLGVILINQGHIDDAISHFRRALEINKENTDAKNNLQNALIQKQQAQ